MKEESCRHCGTSLEVKSKCEFCEQVDQFFCHNCGYTTEKQIHASCIVFTKALVSAQK